MTPYQEAVLSAVRLIPFGNVASYGQIATYVGTPRAARQVGWTMRSLGDASDFPWWRVLNNAGIISIKGNLLNSAQLQKELLESEGVVVGDDFSLHIERYRFRPDEQMLKSMKLDPEYIRSVLDKYQTD